MRFAVCFIVGVSPAMLGGLQREWQLRHPVLRDPGIAIRLIKPINKSKLNRSFTDRSHIHRSNVVP
jgi:hypothetical protein